MAITGVVGANFRLTDTADTATGDVTQLHITPSAIRDMVLPENAIVYSVTGTIGNGSNFDFDFNSVNNQAGSVYDTQVVRNNDGDFTSLKSFVLYNSGANPLLFGASSANNLFIWNNTNNWIVISPSQSVMMCFPTPLTVGASSSKINLKSSSGDVSFSMWILGA
jgi:hypothetical protein